MVSVRAALSETAPAFVWEMDLVASKPTVSARR
jgi:hypothetical protein